MNTIPCMGGFCSLRNKCAHYVEPTNRHEPAERLCTKGEEAEMFFKPLSRANSCDAVANIEDPA